MYNDLILNSKNRFSNIFLQIIVLLLFAGGNLFALDVDSLFSQANNLYKQRSYAEAIEKYEQLIDAGYNGVSLYYNLGNAYYRTGKIGYAILNYEKTLKLEPGDEDAQHNIAIANAQTIDRIETLPTFFLFEWWENLLALFSVSGWTYFSYITYLLLLICAGIYFFAGSPSIQKYSFFASLVFLGLLIVSIVFLTVKLNREHNIKNAVIVEQAVPVKVAPDSKSNDAFVIHEGLKVQLEDSVDNWVKIRLQDGKIGWMTEDGLRVI